MIKSDRLPPYYYETITDGNYMHVFHIRKLADLLVAKAIGKRNLENYALLWLSSVKVFQITSFALRGLLE